MTKHALPKYSILNQVPREMPLRKHGLQMCNLVKHSETGTMGASLGNTQVEALCMDNETTSLSTDRQAPMMGMQEKWNFYLDAAKLTQKTFGDRRRLLVPQREVLGPPCPRLKRTRHVMPSSRKFGNTPTLSCTLTVAGLARGRYPLSVESKWLWSDRVLPGPLQRARTPYSVRRSRTTSSCDGWGAGSTLLRTPALLPWAWGLPADL
eukprot:2983874-Amphidinium_carterae.1